MIDHEDIKNLESEWHLREDIIEKDYVIGWALWAIGSDPSINRKWIFKGGTCLKKCYIETYRFSEDLDFTLLPDDLIDPSELLPIISNIIDKASEESGIDFRVAEPKVKRRKSPHSIECRVYYRGPRNASTPTSIKLDLNSLEKVVRPSVLRNIAHPYRDQLPVPAKVRCYSFEEVFAEKIRAMGERCRPRDLYDIINLYWRRDLQLHPNIIRDVLTDKCNSKGIPLTTLEQVINSPHVDELRSEWKNMLGHQLQALPSFDLFWNELPNLFAWLDGSYMPEVLEAMPIQGDEDLAWTPPPTTWSWGRGIPLESIRFAASNHLCVNLEYRNKKRIIEPYSLRRTKTGNLILHAVRVDNRAHRSYRVDRIQSVDVTDRPFKPKYKVEFEQAGQIHAKSTPRKSDTRKPRGKSSRFGPTYVFECPFCGRTFRRKKNDSKLRSHKDRNGLECPGRRGWLVETEYD
jgi:predicted nucleotidyltransferase component of viral defense system